MKRLIISAITLVSEIQRKGRREEFDPVRTIVLGANDTGKSSLLKAIYATFGAEPAKQHPRWLHAEVKSVVEFQLDGVTYKILRDGNYFAIFGPAGNLLRSFNRIGGEFSAFLAEMFDFGLILPSREESPETPPPAFLFLPFYMDQDASWANSWSSFDRLLQFANWKEAVAEYHSGVRTNAYYRTNAEFIRRRSELASAIGQERGIRSVSKKLQEDTSGASFNLDPDAFNEQIDRLIVESNALASHENTLRESLVEIGGELLTQRNRLAISEKALSELSADFNFLRNQTSDSIDCPTCGTTYANDFALRFSIATDEDRVAEFIAHIRTEIARLELERERIYKDFSITSAQAEKIQKILSEKQGEMTLADVIESEGRRAADNLLRQQLEKAVDERNQLEEAAQRLQEELKAFDVRVQALKEEITDTYGSLLRNNLNALDVTSYSERIFRSLSPRIVETGSTLPRAILAYQFALLQLISTYSPATLCPLVIDSPNQQAQTPENLMKILNFISANQPVGTQMILGLENDMGIEFGGKVITALEKYSILQEDQYEQCHREIYDLIRVSLT